MSIYDRFADSPNRIKIEGQEITLKFVRNLDDGTATISWNIPAPASGCSSDMPGGYDGIVLTVSDEPADYITTSPKDGIYYNGDPTVDNDLHAGDKIGNARVLAAFYNDKTTNSIVITDIKPRTSYYISGYAVDNVGRYHREGVHAYSLPTGPLELNKSKPDEAASHSILIDVLGGIKLNRLTGLESGKEYDFTIDINGKEYVIKINGVDALSYKNLIDAINKELKLLEKPIMLPHYPNLNGYYFDLANYKLYLWNGTTHIQEDVIVSKNDPSIPIIGTHWYNTKDNFLREYQSDGWSIRQFLSFESDPTKIECGQLWYDGVDVWQWDGNHWCKLCLYVQTRSPLLPPILSCNTYWFDTENKLLFQYNDKLKKWDEVLAIMSGKDPNALNTGDFWYNETDKFVYRFVGGTWNQLTTIRYSERNSDGDLDNPIADIYWFIPSELTLYRRDSTNSFWTELDITIYPTDPLIRKSCDLWWTNSNTGISLYTWDSLNNQWVPVSTLFKTIIDPTSSPDLPDCAVWLNPTTGKLKLINNVSCDERPYINFPFDPTQPLYYGYWYDNENKKWYIWNGIEWEDLEVISSAIDPFHVEIGSFWFDLNTNELKQWNGLGWDIINFSDKPLSPLIGTLWFNTIEDELYEWNGSNWIIATPIASLVYSKPKNVKNKNIRDMLEFFTRLTGCNASIEIKDENDNLFRHLKDNIIYMEPVEGGSGIDAGPMYKQLGVGDDGSPDERRALHEAIRLHLGAISVRIEVTKEQIDEAINNALLMVRKYSNLSYKRGMFFLDLKRNQQTYIMTNKCAGFNKIVDVNGIYRMKSAFFRTAYAGNDLFGIAALQQLYTLGSFDLLSFHLVSSYMKELETAFANRIMFQWIETSRELKMYQNFLVRERVLVDATIERTEQDLFTNRETSLWIKNWSIATVKLMLSQTRGKFQQLPGPNGSTALNTQDLISQAQSEMEILRKDLEDFAMQDAGDIGLRAHFILG